MNDLKRHFDILAVALGLKYSGTLIYGDAEGKKNDQILFSTYKTMLKQNQNKFFIDNQKLSDVLESLDRSLRFSHAETREEAEQLIHQLKSETPSSFILCRDEREKNTPSHASGLLLYKNKNKDYLIYNIDKNRNIDKRTSVNFLTIPADKLTKLSKILLEEKLNYRLPGASPFENLRKIVDLSEEKFFLPTDISLSLQTIGNCYIKNIEAAFKVALHRCNHSINYYSKDSSTTPKWNNSLASTLKMRYYFTLAMKKQMINSAIQLDDPALNITSINKMADKLFQYYLEKKKIKTHGWKDQETHSILEKKTDSKITDYHSFSKAANKYVADTFSNDLETKQFFSLIDKIQVAKERKKEINPVKKHSINNKYHTL
ncbi:MULTISPECIES: hypothetical protein [unclassified Enterococcus]|uniref:hypothetical protein n=1 Tax=unclassified Enterococcus TaxID=2608891 RepID=UPI0013EADF86|nr:MULTISPECIES: hypothetical protein [unclassified Enterococcus]